MKSLAFITLTLIAFQITYAQNASQTYYWIKLKNKEHNSFSINNPQQFLSAKSIERRSKQGIAVDNTDLPITQLYIDSLAPYITNLVHRLKWFNTVVVKVDDPNNIDSIRQLSFVDSIAPIRYFPYKSLQRQNKFEAVTPDQTIAYPSNYGASYHQINMMNADLVHLSGYTGQGIIMAIMDNGLSGVDHFKAFDSMRSHILVTWDFVHNRSDLFSDGSHGTNTLSCVAANLPGQYVGSATGADFCLFQTEDNNAEWVMEEYNWAAAAEMADSMGAQLFSTSLGYTIFDSDTLSNIPYSDLNGNTTVMTQTGNIASSKGILVFNSAGNEGTNAKWGYHISAPADGDSIIAVGAVDSLRQIAGFSSRGPNGAGRIKPDLCAEGSKAAIIDAGGNPAYSSGTSFSCPLLAGCAASLWSAFPDKSALEIKEAILKSADRYKNPDNTYGYGIPDFYLAYTFLKTGYNATLMNVGNDITVYPNPFSTELNAIVYNADGKEHRIEIYNLLGQKVFDYSFFVRDKNYAVINFNNLANLQPGEYILRYDGSKTLGPRLLKLR